MKEEFKKLGVVVFILYLFFQIHYFKTSPFLVLRLLLAHLYLYVIPGYCVMLYYLGRIDFSHRLFIGAGFGYAVSGLLAFFITLIFHINLKSFYLLLPLPFIIFGIILIKRKYEKNIPVQHRTSELEKGLQSE